MPEQQSKHTPGPWSIENFSPDHLEIGNYEGENCQAICQVLYYGASDAIDEANADFIIGACNAHDDLLAALIRMVAENEPAAEDSPRRAGYEQAQAAITKATKGEL